MRRLRLWLAVVAVAWPLPAPAQAAPTVLVDASRPTGRPINHELLGLVHQARTRDVEELLRTRVPRLAWMRVDAFLEGSVTVETDPQTGLPRSFSFDPRAVDERLRSVEASGARPLLIVDYMPPGLADPVCRQASRFFPGPSRCPPADDALWEQLVAQLLRHACCETNLVTGQPNAVRWFEVWNEPDLPVFFAGTLADYLRIYQATNRALRRVEAEEGVDLWLGGCACFFPDPLWIGALLAFVAASRSSPLPEGALDLDFLSWHHYANNPFVGPFETLRVTPDADNPLLGAGVYRDQAELVRALAQPYRAAGLDPLLWIDEWNVNAGADDRHGTAYGAAFTAAALHAMQDAGVARSARFNTQDNSPSPFETWGMFTYAGLPKPAFHAFQMWSRLEPEEVAVTAPSPPPSAPGAGPADRRYRTGVLASRAPGLARITVLLYDFAPYRERDPFQASVEVTGAAGRYEQTVYLADAEHARVGDTELAVLSRRDVQLPGALSELALPANSVALLELERKE